ncbi:MAG: hypothetical protein DHS20C05_14660 [Hyphococcus sp.]|nr:MAG: hypothetical protein DHS20C05_14660 [Marinicaulis sp.]
MKNIRIFSGLLIGAVSSVALLSGPAAAQNPPTEIVKQAMEKFAWLEGEWRGEGWSYNREGGRDTFQVHEIATYQLDGVVLTFHGRGWSVDEDGAEVEGHKAFGVVSYDAYAQTYRFDAFVKEGYQSRSTPEVGENEYRWAVSAGPDAEMRYHARLEDDGAWVETGERCVEDKCTPMMQMRLEKVMGE